MKAIAARISTHNHQREVKEKAFSGVAASAVSSFSISTISGASEAIDVDWVSCIVSFSFTVVSCTSVAGSSACVVLLLKVLVAPSTSASGALISVVVSSIAVTAAA